MKDIVLDIIDNETGEVIDNICEGESYRKTTAEQKAYLQNTEVINKDKRYTRVYDIALRILAKMKLSSKETSVLLILISHLGWGEYEGYIINLKNNQFNGYMTQKDLLPLTICYDKSDLSKTIKSLIDKGIVAKDDDKLMLNPFLFEKGITSHRRPKKIIEKFRYTPFNY